jgi:hypothetical protein
MAVARCFGVVALALVAAGAARAQTCPLTENPQANDCHLLHLTMALSGEMVVQQEGKPVKLKLSATAEHRYRERVLAAHPYGAGIGKAARFYDDARATITVDGNASPRGLRAERRLTVAQRQSDTLLCYSPQGPLTREELETVSEHFDTLALAGLLPGKEVKVGETWTVSNPAVQSLCLFEGLIANELTGKLTEVKGGTATFTVEGTARGIELGAQAKLTITATGRYDVATKHITALTWKQKDERDQGPASPAVNAETTVTVTRQMIEEPKELSDVALVSVPQAYDVPEPLKLLTVRDGKGRFELACARDWQVVGQTDAHLVLRLLDRGDFVAQATVTPWQKAEPGKHAEVKEFRDQMLSSPGWQPEEVMQEGELPKQASGRFVYRVVARGEMDGVKVVQSFFLVAGPKGDQAVVAFTLKQAQVTKLGVRDLLLVDGLDFPAK